MRVADSYCHGKLVMCHEGGYSAPTVPFFALAVIEALSGIDSGVEDPFDRILSAMGQQELQPHQAQLIDAVAAASLGALKAALVKQR